MSEQIEDCISRQALLKKAIYLPIAKRVTDDKVIYREIVFTNMIENMPPVTPKPNTGHWIKHEHNGIGHIECSECLCWFLEAHLLRNSYCPNCGAKMEVE